MVKNLFSIPTDTAGNVLSFLEGNQALIFYSMYSILNKKEDFVPKDYYLSVRAEDYNIWSTKKSFKSLDIDCLTQRYTESLNLGRLTYIERLQATSYRFEAVGLEKLVNLKSLNVLSLIMDMESLKKFSHLEEFGGELLIRMEDDEKIRLNLRSYIGTITFYTVDRISLNKYLNPDKLEELDIYCIRGKKILTLDTFIHLKKLKFGDVLESLSDLKPLVNLQELNLTQTDVFDWMILSGMTKLQKLSVKYSSSVNVEYLSNRVVEGLTELRIEGPLEESIKNKLPNMTRLITLSLINPDCSIIKYLPTNLEHLILFEVIGDMDFFKHIQRLTSLRKLEISFKRGFRSSMMKYVAKLPNLEELFFNKFNRFSVNSLRDLESLSKLKIITIMGNTSDISRENLAIPSHLGELIINLEYSYD
jgi:hypothetical protein